MLYQVQPRDRRFVEKIGKNISKNLSGKYSQNLLDHAKQPATDVLKTISKMLIQ